MSQPMLVALAAFFFWADQALAGGAEGQIAGTVRSVTTGETLKSAVVILRLQGGRESFSRTTTSGLEGTFGFDGLPAGRYQLTVQKTGYRTLHGSAGRVTLQGNRQANNLVFGLWPTAAISGRVLDPEGEPVAGARVRAHEVRYQQAGVRLSLAARARGDDLGEYRVFGLPAGRYLLHVSPPRADTPAGQFYSDTAGAFYPGVTAPSQALPLEVHWGHDLAGIDLTLSDDPAYAVVSAVADATMEGPCTRCFVRAVRIDGPLRTGLPNTSRVSREGLFALRGLPPGDYKLIGWRGRNAGMVAQSDVSIRDRDLDDVGLVVGLKQEVSGRIVLEEPPDDVDATEWIPLLSPVELPRSWPEVKGEVSEDLRLEIEDVPPATYHFAMQDLPAGAYLKALRNGGRPLARPRIAVLEDATVTGLQAVIAFDGSTVSGQVRPRRSGANGEAVEARVFLTPKQNASSYQTAKRVQTAPDGSFRFASVVPGGYTLYALPLMSSPQIFDPAVQSSLRTYSRQVDLDPGESVTVDLPLGPDRE